MGKKMVKKTILLISLLFVFSHNVYPKDRIVAVVLASNISKFKVAYDVFQSRLKESGLLNTIQFVVSTTNPDPSSWANAVKRAEGHEVDLIVAFGAPLVHSAIKEKVSIPIIFADLYEPKIIEGTKSQVGGVYNNIPVATIIKNVNAIKAVSTIHVLFCTFEKESELQAEKIKQVAGFEKMNVMLHPITSSSKMPNFNLGSNDVIFLTASVVLEGGLSRIISFADTHKVPVVGVSEAVTAAGGVIAIAPEAKEQGVALAEYFTKYFQTNKMPPNVQITKVNFIVNLQAANKLSLTIPFSVINNSTKVIK